MESAQTTTRRPPSAVARAALGVAAGAVLLAAAGRVGPAVGVLSGVGGAACLVVALGGTVLGVTLAAVGLLHTRDPADPSGRGYAWAAGAVSLVLLGALVLALAGDAGPPVWNEPAAAPTAHQPR